MKTYDESKEEKDENYTSIPRTPEETDEALKKFRDSEVFIPIEEGDLNKYFPKK